MAFDGIVTKSVVNELNCTLTNGKINKIFQPNKNEVLLGIYSNGKNFALNICIDSNNYRMHLTTNSKPNPLNAPNFCMLLRKYILGYKIKNISSYDFERIIILHLEGYDELNDLTNKKLIIELMGKHSNIILVNDKDFIIDSLRHLDISSNSYRDILPAHAYVFPENNKCSFTHLASYTDFRNILFNTNSDISININIVNNFIGFSLPFVNNILDILNIDKNISTLLINDNDLNKLYDYINSIINGIANNQSSIKLVYNDRGKKDYVIDLRNKDEVLEVNFFLDDFYFSKENNDAFLSYRNNILKLILNTLSKYSNRLKNIDKKLLECSNRDKYKLYGELITANLYKYRNENLTSITLENYYDNNKEITIPLDFKISVHNNANKYFKKYTKLKNALEIVTIQKNDTKQDIEYLESIIYELENSKTVADINEIYTELSKSNIFSDLLNQKSSKSKKKKSKEDTISSPREFKIGEYTVLVGKNNLQNDYLTTKLAYKNDIWFHTKDIHGSHVILRTNNNLNIDDEILVQCAEIAAFYSKAKLSSNVPVDYCFVRYVKKPSGSKPGMVIYTNNKTLNVTPKSMDN